MEEARYRRRLWPLGALRAGAGGTARLECGGGRATLRVDAQGLKGVGRVRLLLLGPGCWVEAQRAPVEKDGSVTLLLEGTPRVWPLPPEDVAAVALAEESAHPALLLEGGERSRSEKERVDARMRLMAMLAPAPAKRPTPPEEPRAAERPCAGRAEGRAMSPHGGEDAGVGLATGARHMERADPPMETSAPARPGLSVARRRVKRRTQAEQALQASAVPPATQKPPESQHTQPQASVSVENSVDAARQSTVRMRKGAGDPAEPRAAADCRADATAGDGMSICQDASLQAAQPPPGAVSRRGTACCAPSPRTAAAPPCAPSAARASSQSRLIPPPTGRPPAEPALPHALSPLPREVRLPALEAAGLLRRADAACLRAASPAAARAAASQPASAALPPSALPASAASAPAGPSPAARAAASQPVPPSAAPSPSVYAAPAAAAASASAPVPVTAPSFSRPPASPIRSSRRVARPLGALPALRWPPEIGELKRYFETMEPFMPFDALGWRFVRVPLAGGAGYFALGVQARGGEVAKLCYAVPGSNEQPPPAALTGYRWQQGLAGVGYWTLWQKVDQRSHSASHNES